MRPEDQLLFACTRQNFQAEHRQAVLNVDRSFPLRWELVRSTAELHGVAPLVYANLKACMSNGLSIPEKTIRKFESSLLENVARKEYRADRLRDTLAYLNEKGIEALLVKGAALDLVVYECSWYTAPKDIDLILKSTREDFPLDCLQEFSRRVQDFAIEYDFFGHHDVNINGVLPIDFSEIWKDAQHFDFRGQRVRIMSPEDLLLTSCVNSCRKRFFRLKNLCDLSEIVSRYPHLSWDKLAARARRFQCSNIVYAALVTTKLTVGCDVTRQAMASLKVNSVRRAIIRSLARMLLAHRLSTLHKGPQILGRPVNLTLLLPNVAYRFDQIWRKAHYVWSTRSTSHG